MSLAAAAFPEGSDDQRRGVAIFSLTEVWERFSYAGTRAILVLYLTDYLLKAGHREKVIGIDPLQTALESLFGPLSIDSFAFQIYGLYVGLFFFTPLFLGVVADRVTGHRKAILIGAVIMAAGQFCLASERLALVGLLLMVIGGGLFKPTISAQLGALFERDDPRGDRAFAIFYVAINIGTFFAPLVCGTLGERYGWQYGLVVAGIGNLISLIIYATGKVAVPSRRSEKDSLPGSQRVGARRQIAGLVLLSLMTPLFWAAYEQKGAAVVLWAKRSVDLEFGGQSIPTSWILMLNPLFIFLLTPLLALLWKRSEPATLSKMILGFVVLAAAFVLLAIAATTGPGVAVGWIVGFMALLTLGELLLSPIGLSLFSRTAPPGFGSRILAIWFFSMFVGNYSSGLLASRLVDLDRPSFFLAIAALPLIGATLLLIARRPLNGILFGTPPPSLSPDRRSPPGGSNKSPVP